MHPSMVATEIFLVRTSRQYFRRKSSLRSHGGGRRVARFEVREALESTRVGSARHLSRSGRGAEVCFTHCS